MSYQSERVKGWRKRTKERMVEAFGGQCCMCGYDRFEKAMAFHHVNPENKEFSFGKAMSHIVSWETLVEEMRKCVMVCLNCHREIHYGFSEVPDDAPRFNEDYAEYREEREDNYDECPECGGPKLKSNYTCSYECAGKRSWRVDWNNIDLDYLINVKQMPFTRIGDMLGVSDNAVRKRARKIGII